MGFTFIVINYIFNSIFSVSCLNDLNILYMFLSQFNPSMPIEPDSPHFNKSPGLKDKIHCVVYVIDTSKAKLLSDKMINKFAVFRRKTNQLGKIWMNSIYKVTWVYCVN